MKTTYQLWIVLEEYNENGDKVCDYESVKLLEVKKKKVGIDAFLTAQAATVDLIAHTHGKEGI